MNIAINGLGRIGRNILRLIFEKEEYNNINIIAINDLCNNETIAHLLNYDTVHGKFKLNVSTYDNGIIIKKKNIICLSEKNIKNLPWKDMNIDVVLECSGKFNATKYSNLHIKSGAKKVLISTNGDEDVDITIVYGINHKKITSNHKIISNSSCSTNCLAFLIKPLISNFKLENGYVNTIHSFTNDQSLIDGFKNDLRRSRAANYSIIPTTTGSIKAIGKIFPKISGKIQGIATRVPTINVSFLDFVFYTKHNTNVKEINTLLKSFAKKNEYKQFVTYNELPLVSIDFNHTSYSCIFDLTQTKVIGNLIKVSAWYDNEWGYSNRMIDVLNYIC